jgi:hypothetical protein
VQERHLAGWRAARAGARYGEGSRDRHTRRAYPATSTPIRIGAALGLSSGLTKSVAFIIGNRQRRGEWVRLPIGTGFVLGVRPPPEPPPRRAFTLYLATAAHVVKAEESTWIRLRRLGGELEDLPVVGWSIHEHADVAVAVLDLDERHTPYDIAVLPIPDFLPEGAEQRYGDRRRPLSLNERPMLGDTVYFIGLFTSLPSLGDRNVPLVRSGTLAAMSVEDVPVTMTDRTVARYKAHLIDCRSYAGFSGSPCLVQFPKKPGVGGVGRPDEETELLGVFSSHFDWAESAAITGDLADFEGSVRFSVNLGVGVVTPAESIVELLERDDVRGDRLRRERGYTSE